MRLRYISPVLCLIAVSPGYAFQFTWGPPVPFVHIRVGHQGGRVEIVEFAIPSGQAGNGVPVIGSPAVEIRFIGRRFRAGDSNFIVTIDSSAGLSNGFGDSIPFSDFSWTTQDGDIAPGQFDDSANQLLFQYAGPFIGFGDTLTFEYANVTVYPAGTYTGRVTYTISQL